MICCKNVGNVDRLLRALIGVVAIILAFAMFHLMDGEVPGIIAVVGGVVLLATAAIAMCPLYLPFKMSTCKTRPKG